MTSYRKFWKYSCRSLCNRFSQWKSFRCAIRGSKMWHLSKKVLSSFQIIIHWKFPTQGIFPFDIFAWNVNNLANVPGHSVINLNLLPFPIYHSIFHLISFLTRPFAPVMGRPVRNGNEMMNMTLYFACGWNSRREEKISIKTKNIDCQSMECYIRAIAHIPSNWMVGPSWARTVQSYVLNVNNLTTSITMQRRQYENNNNPKSALKPPLPQRNR